MNKPDLFENAIREMLRDVERRAPVPEGLESRLLMSAVLSDPQQRRRIDALRRWTVPILAAAAVAAMVVATLVWRTAVTDHGARPANSGTPTPQSAVTQDITLRPVTARGDLVPGWTVDNRSSAAGPIDCTSRVEASGESVSPNVYSCSPSSASADACWRSSTPLHMVCVWDVVDRKVALLPTDAMPGPVDRWAHPVPFELVLADGNECRRRGGGALAVPPDHRGWSAYYVCQGQTAVWAPTTPTLSDDGFDSSQPRWTVFFGPYDGTELKTVAVATAYFVGTAE